jgi:hypothetical protein
MEKIYYLQDIKTNEYVSRNWRDPRDMNITEAREFQGIKDIESLDSKRKVGIFGGVKRDTPGNGADSNYEKKVGLFEANIIAINPTAEEYSDMLEVLPPMKW